MRIIARLEWGQLIVLGAIFVIIAAAFPTAEAAQPVFVKHYQSVATNVAVGDHHVTVALPVAQAAQPVFNLGEFHKHYQPRGFGNHPEKGPCTGYPEGPPPGISNSRCMGQ